MIERIIYLFLTSILTCSFCSAQDLLSVDWHKVVCSDGYIDHVYSICNDTNGNTFTLGSFENKANCLGDSVDENLGKYFVTKQNSNGDKLFVKNIGGTNSFTFGDIQVCDNGDLVFGLCFKSNFYLNGDSIAYSENWSSIIVKLDQDFVLKWFKTFPGLSNTYIDQIVLDKDENIYATIQFLGSLSINNQNYQQAQGYGSVIVKLNPIGTIEWTHHYNSNYNLTTQVLKVAESCNLCPSNIFISGKVLLSDSIFVDGVFKAQNKSKYNQHFFVSTLNEFGDILQTEFLEDGIGSIADLNVYQNRIFIAGTYFDTVSWNGTFVTPFDYSSCYLGELSEELDLIGFVDLQTNKSVYLTGFNISKEFGFLISGIFDGYLKLKSISIPLANQYDRGSFIAGLNDQLLLNDLKYIKGGSFNLRHLSVFQNYISGTAVFEHSCNFQNSICFSWNDDISTFQTKDLKLLSEFNPIVFPEYHEPIPFSFEVYPNPFFTSFKLKFSEKIDSNSIKMTDAAGQLCKDIVITEMNDNEMIFDAIGLSPGLYFVNFLTSNNYNATYKLIKLHD